MFGTLIEFGQNIALVFKSQLVFYMDLIGKCFQCMVVKDLET